MSTILRRDLGELLLEERLITEGVLRAARRMARRERLQVVVLLLEEGHITEDQLVDLLSRRLRLPVVEPTRLSTEPDVLSLIPFDLAEKYRVLPVGLTEGAPPMLRVAMVDPLDREAIAELERVTGHPVEPLIAPASTLTKVIRHRYRGVITRLTPTHAPERQTPIARLSHTPPVQEHDPCELSTQPLPRLYEDAPQEIKLRALVNTLVEAGVITERAYAQALHRLLREDEAG